MAARTKAKLAVIPLHKNIADKRQYEAVRRTAEEENYTVTEACRALRIFHAGYYQWCSGRAGARTMENIRLAGLVKKLHAESPDKGYRCIRDDLARYYSAPGNDKRALRICRSLGIRSTIQYARHGCTRQASGPQYLAENVLNRQFYADKPNEKWLTDVTEFKYYVGSSVHKLYLSAILDLCDRRIVSFVPRDTNDSALVHETLDQDLAANPDTHPLFHSDRGRYTTRVFHDQLAAAWMAQSMSRVGKCIDNGPMEGFWGILKWERYYGRNFTSREQLSRMIRELYCLLQFRPPPAPAGRPYAYRGLCPMPPRSLTDACAVRQYTTPAGTLCGFSTILYFISLSAWRGQFK